MRRRNIYSVLMAIHIGICLSLDPEKGPTHVNRSEGICGNIEIWSTNDEDVRYLQNCSVVEGYVRLMKFSVNDADDFNISFPNLREITDYLMVYQVSVVESLGDMFPNLSVIRGNTLFDKYALIIFENFDLRTISLTSLSRIIEGDIFIASNINLCFVDTVDWNLIAPGSRKNYITSNKNPNECPVCSHCSKSSTGKANCWNENECQNICPSSCPESCHDRSCCHDSCLGGCWEYGADKCYSCKSFFFRNSCVSTCPNNTYVYSGWRCTSESECRNFSRPSLSKIWIPHNGHCILECPPGYHKEEVVINGQARFHCLKCEGGLCRKECRGASISNVEDSMKMIGCTVIEGGIVMTLPERKNNIVPEIEKNLNSIEEIRDYLKIYDSYQLTSLNFLKNLKIIRGQNLNYNSKYSLMVVGNRNLEFLWDFENKGSNLTINGPVYFRNNPKLCLNKIKELLIKANVSSADSIVPTLTNGVKNVCDLAELSVSVDFITSSSATIFWTPFEFHDTRNLMGYTIYIKEAIFKNITVFDGRNECGGGDWKIYDIEDYDCCANNFTVKGLKPFKQYAFYVKTITVNSDFGAQSVISYFNTKPGIPLMPLNLNVTTNSSTEIFITWLPPLLPNGVISHYLVSVQQISHIFVPIDHCEDEGLINNPNNNSTYTEPVPVLIDYTEYPYQVSHESKKQSEDQIIKINIKINFENKLLNYIYVKKKRPKRSSLTSNDFQPNISTVIPLETCIGNSSPICNNVDEEGDRDYIFSNKVVYGNSLYVSSLKHFTSYRVEVRACRQLSEEESPRDLNIYCSGKAIEHVQTNPLIMADSIRDEFPFLEVSNKIPGTVILKWEEPEDPNGDVLTYSVEYRRSGESSFTECINHEQFVKSGKSYILKNLRPGNYSVRVRPSSSSGPGSYTSPKYFYVKDDNSFHTYIYLIFGTLVFILPLAIAYCVYYLKKSEENKLFISVNPEYIHKTYIPDTWEIPRNQIDLIKEIGQGSFGMVYEGLLNSKPCAVKTVNAQASDSEKKEFLNEASVMKAFNTYHVVKLLGVVSLGEPVYVVMELMPKGDLKSFLRSHRPDMCDPHARPPSVRRLLQMSAEIADGMAYLSAKKYVHRDLAARNCMVSENLTVKIGDFGMARDIYVGDYYRKGTRGLMPVRWMAPESLRDGIFLSASDVWSYGIVLYEMITLAAQPYQGLTNDQVLRYVMDGGIMERPENCADKMFMLMKQCWKMNPSDRPSFLGIVEVLHEDASLNFHTVSFYDSEEGKEHRQNLEPVMYSSKRPL